jgi:hypothetical protein
MSVNNFNITQIEQELAKLNYNVVWLEDQNGLKLMNANNPNVTRTQQVKKIDALLKSAATPQGWYNIKALPAVRSKQEPMCFHYAKGQADQQQRHSMSESSNQIAAMTPDKVFAIFAENATLKAETEALRKQLLASEARELRSEEMLEDLRKQNQTMSEGAAKGPTLMEGLIAAAPALPEIIGAIRELIKPTPAPALAAKPQPDGIAQALAQILHNQQAMNVRMSALEAAAQPDEPFTAVELLDGLESGEFTEEQVQNYLNDNPEIIEEYEHERQQRDSAQNQN